MKKITIMLSAMLLVFATSCEVDSIDQDVLEMQRQEDARKERKKKDIAVTPLDVDVDLANLNDACVTVDLIAGQHYTAGDVSVYNDGENLIVVFRTTGDWDLGTTHLSLGNCDEDWVPLTPNGNPKIGNFQYTTPYSVGDNEVTYVIPLEGLDDNYCFAAHAEVQGPDGGETAWGQGSQIGGRSWAMYVESSLTDCPTDGDDGGDDDGGGDQQPV